MYSDLNLLPNSREISVKEMMNPNFAVIHPETTLREVVEAYVEQHMDTLPVTDSKGDLSGVFPRSALYKALLDGRTMDDICAPYVISSSVTVNTADQTYNVSSLMEKANQSQVRMVPVLADKGSDRVVGMLSGDRYFREIYSFLSESLAFVNSIFHGMDQGMIVVDNDGKILLVNQRAEKMFDVSFSDIRGQKVSRVFPEIEFEMISAEHEEAERFHCMIQNHRVIVNAVPIVRDGVRTGINIMIQDVSTMEKISQELESTKELHATLSGVLNAFEEGVFVTALSGKIKYVNRAGCDLLRMEKNHIIGRKLEEFIAGVQQQLMQLGEPDVCEKNNQTYIVFHTPIIKDKQEERKIGTVSVFYNSENKMTESIARSWFSLRQQLKYYQKEFEKSSAKKDSFDKIVSRSRIVERLKAEAMHISRSTSTVLITGESGVGKDMFARAIHGASKRAKEPFVKVNCTAIPESLMESELFGYAPGSFTGALQKGKPGFFEQANHGTIFLDEIGDMPLSVQAKLLQVLQDKQFIRVGGTKPESVDIRIISATNKDLITAIREGEFREDLYYRLNVIELRIPPLRERPEDILLLARMFIEKYNEILDSKVIGMSKKAEALLQEYRWPGNVRELENAIERAANYAWEGEIMPEHLPRMIRSSQEEEMSAVSYRAERDSMDKEIIKKALEITNGNRSAAARYLKISRSALYEKLDKYGLL